MRCCRLADDLLTFALSREWISPESLLALVALPPVGVSGAGQALPGAVVAPARRERVGVAAAVAGAAGVAQGQRVAEVAVVTPQCGNLRVTKKRDPNQHR